MKPVLGYVSTLVGVVLLFVSILGAGDHLALRGPSKHATIALTAAGGAGALIGAWSWLREGRMAAPRSAVAPRRRGSADE